MLAAAGVAALHVAHSMKRAADEEDDEEDGEETEAEKTVDDCATEIEKFKGSAV